MYHHITAGLTAAETGFAEWLAAQAERDDAVGHVACAATKHGSADALHHRLETLGAVGSAGGWILFLEGLLEGVDLDAIHPRLADALAGVKASAEHGRDLVAEDGPYWSGYGTISLKTFRRAEVEWIAATGSLPSLRLTDLYFSVRTDELTVRGTCSACGQDERIETGKDRRLVEDSHDLPPLTAPCGATVSVVDSRGWLADTAAMRRRRAARAAEAVFFEEATA